MKLNNQIKKELEYEGYRIVGNHSAIKICNWTKNSLRNRGFCYKQKFYGIKSHQCVQMSCTLLNCQNKCMHCWRNLKYTAPGNIKNPDLPEEIIEKCIKEQQKILQGFRGNKKTNFKKFEEAMHPLHFAISLTGEGTLYPYLGKLIKELRERNITSFLVTNGLAPEVLKELNKKNQLPTQLYVSLNAPNEQIYNKITNSQLKNAWKKFNETLALLPKIKTRRVLRMTLVRDLNMTGLEGYAELIKKARVDFIEVKAFMAVGFSRKRLAYERMPLHLEIKEFAKKLAKLTNLKILDEKKESRVVLLGKSRKDMKIRSI